MRVYISVDLEGINGVCHSSHTQPGEPGYERGVQLMHAETNAVIQGARAGGATEVIVNDSHWDARNLRTELLEPGTTLVTGWQKPYSMVSQVSGNDCAFFIGYHCMAGKARAVLSHTYRAQVFYDVKLNGKSVGETGLNAALAAHFKVPVALVTGDDATCEEANDELPGVKTVTVKHAVSRYAAIFRPHQDVLNELKQAAMSALKDQKFWKLYNTALPATLTVTTIDTAMADAAELLPMVKRVNDRTVELTHDDYSVLFRLMLAIGALGASRRDPHF